MHTDFNEKIETELLDFIQSNYGMEVFTPGLQRTFNIYRPFKDEIKKRGIKVTTIAGTNGKGQTAHTLAYLLSNAGLKVGLWTSPHILSVRERFNFRGAAIDDDISYEVLFDEAKCTHDFLKKDYADLKVSFYEFLFLVFLRICLSSDNTRSIDHMILEVGLGGRLDAVNHFDADCACITSISRDHQAILGNRFDLILSEKIAIARRGSPLFTQFHLNYLNEITKKYCSLHGILWRPLPKEKTKNGNYFLENQQMAQVLFEHFLPEKEGRINREIPLFKGRREVMTFNGNDFIFIGAHNIDGVRRLFELMQSEPKNLCPTQILVSFSKRPIDEVEIMLKTMIDFEGNDSKLLLTYFDHPKALDKNLTFEVGEKINKINKGLLDFVLDWKTYLIKAKNQKILVCGSYYFVGEVQRFIHTHS